VQGENSGREQRSLTGKPLASVSHLNVRDIHSELLLPGAFHFGWYLSLCRVMVHNNEAGVILVIPLRNTVLLLVHTRLL
jgi:hypothetical protein